MILQLGTVLSVVWRLEAVSYSIFVYLISACEPLVFVFQVMYCIQLDSSLLIMNIELNCLVIKEKAGKKAQVKLKPVPVPCLA